MRSGGSAGPKQSEPKAREPVARVCTSGFAQTVFKDILQEIGMQSESSSNQAPNAFQTQRPNHFRNFHRDRIQNELQIHAKRHLQNVLQNRMQKGLQIGSQNELKMKVPSGSQNELKNKLKMTTKNDSRIEASKSQPK